MAVVISSILKTSAQISVSIVATRKVILVDGKELTNKILLPSADHQRNEADHANQRGRETEHESEVDGGFVVFALDVGEEEEGEGVDCCCKQTKVSKQYPQHADESPLTKDITRLIHSEIEVKRLRRVEDAARPFLLRPLHADRHAAEESVHPEDDEVDQEDVSGHGVDGFS